jgi:hypothetical protein
MEPMRFCLCLLAFGALVFAADNGETTTLRGKLSVRAGKATVVESEGRSVVIEGDEFESKVLADSRLNGFEIEAKGRFTSPDHFTLNPSHTHPMLVRQNGKLKLVTYWCEICSIRAYTPGPCVCCQRETTVDLRDPD